MLRALPPYPKDLLRKYGEQLMLNCMPLGIILDQ